MRLPCWLVRLLIGYHTARWRLMRNTYRCPSCGRLERLFGRRVGEHRRCAPF
jgi:hypothetical protein